MSPFLGQQYGGSERYCYNLSRHLAARGHDVTIYTTKLRNSDPSIEKKNGVTIHRFYAPKVVWNINPVALMIHKLLKCNFDVVHVHSHLYFSSIQAAISRRIRRKPPMVIHLHGGVGPPPTLKLGTIKLLAKTLFDKTFARFTLNSADIILSISQHDLNYAVEVFNIDKNKIIIVPNGVDTKVFFPRRHLKSKTERLIYVGDLELWKGLSYLIGALKKLANDNRKVSLTIVGDGDSREKLERLAQGLPIEFLGQQPHARIPHLLRNSSVFVIPSLWEGIPTVALEAMASGIPVIATDVGGIREIVSDGKTGIVVPSKNPEAIAQAVIKISEKSSLRDYLCKNALRMIRLKYDFEKITSDVEKVYDCLI